MIRRVFLCVVCSRPRLPYLAWMVKELSHLLRWKKHNKSHLWLHWLIRNLSLKGGETFKLRQDRQGPGRMGRARESCKSLLCLRRVLQALPSLQLSRQSLAVSALRPVCSPRVSAALTLSQSSRKVVEEKVLVARQFSSYLQYLHFYFILYTPKWLNVCQSNIKGVSKGTVQPKIKNTYILHLGLFISLNCFGVSCLVLEILTVEISAFSQI